MTPALLHEAADRLELSVRKFWSVDVVPPKEPFCSICSTDYPAHTPDCLITRLRQAASPEMPEGLRKVIEQRLAVSTSCSAEQAMSDIATEYAKGAQ